MEASPKIRPFQQPPPQGGHRLLSVQPDAVLCRMAARGSDAAYEALYCRYHRAVYAFVFHLLGGRDCAADAEDIAQDSFAKAFAGIAGKRDGSFRHWIMTIARNRAIDHMRARAPRALPLHDETVEHDPAIAVDCASAEAEGRADFAWVIDAVGELPSRQREALVLRELAGMSHADIAEQLSTSVQATKQLIKRGRAGIGESARSQNIRPHNLRRELTLAAPLLPVVATAGLGVAGAGAAGFGSSALAGKAAAAVLCVAAIGGTTAAVERSLSAYGPNVTTNSARVAEVGRLGEQLGNPAAPETLGEAEPAKDREAVAKRDRRDRQKDRGDERGVRRDGATAAPSRLPADSGSAVAGGGGGGAVSAPPVGYGPARGDDALGGSETGGAAAPE